MLWPFSFLSSAWNILHSDGVSPYSLLPGVLCGVPVMGNWLFVLTAASSAAVRGTFPMAGDLLIGLAVESSVAIRGTFPLADELLVELAAASSSAIPMADELLIELTAKLLTVRGFALSVGEISIVLLADVRWFPQLPARFVWTVSTADLRGSSPMPAQSFELR